MQTRPDISPPPLSVTRSRFLNRTHAHHPFLDPFLSFYLLSVSSLFFLGDKALCLSINPINAVR